MYKMFTADQARKRGMEGSLLVDGIIQNIEKEIMERSTNYTRLVTYEPRTWTSAPLLNIDVQPNQLQQRVIERLRDAGYDVCFAPFSDAYVPKGLQDDDGKGPLYVNWCIVIDW